jgi:hypothetical protein
VSLIADVFCNIVKGYSEKFAIVNIGNRNTQCDYIERSCIGSSFLILKFVVITKPL